MKWRSSVFTILWKDMLCNFRSPQTMVSIPFFALVMVFILAFAVNMGDRTSMEGQTAAGMLWVALTFAGVIGLSQTFVAEKENSCLKGLLLCPVERHTVFLGKLIGTFLMISIMEVVATPAFLALFSVSCRIPDLIPIIVLTTIGLSAVGTLFSAIASASRRREVLFPILFFPMIIPVLIAAVKATGSVFDGNPLGDTLSWLKVIIAFDALFITVSLLVFGATVEES